VFVSQAHSFGQQARLAVTLAWVGGYANIVTFLACGTAVSHVSGTASQFGRGLGSMDMASAGFCFLLLGTFLAGAAVSGFCTELGRRRGWESIYVLPIALETLLLGGFAALLFLERATDARWLMLGLASGAMGLQNATISRISSGIVRTTHVTGTLTDLGHDTAQFLWWLFDRLRETATASTPPLGQRIRKNPAARHVALLAGILAMFILGAGLAAWAHEHLPRGSMFPAVAFLLWLIHQDLARPIAAIEPSALLDKAGGLGLPEGITVYHLRKEKDRGGEVHRLPNLLGWSDRLPAGVRVVVLDLAEITELNANAALELRAVVAHFKAQRRELILTGINSVQFQRLNRPGGVEPVAADNVCSDLDLAIARGINLLDQAPLAAPLMI
jgi:uncharacterized membrane protein YoaK (UPF0700 family)